MTDNKINKKKYEHVLLVILITSIILMVLVFIKPSIIGFIIYSILATQQYDPITDVQTGWICTGTTCGTGHYTVLDDGIRRPTAPNTADYISQAANGGNIDEHNINIVNQTNINYITLWVYAATGSNHQMTISFQNNNVQVASSIVSPGTAASWIPVNWTSPSGIGTLSAEFISAKVGGGASTQGYVYAWYTEVDYTVTDTTPPASVTNLQNQSSGTSWIYWTWTNPIDSDFNSSIVYINNINLANTTNSYYNATGLSCGTSYTIKIYTKDNTGNVNTTNVTNTAATKPCPDLIAPIVYSIVPANNSVDIDGNIYFNCSATDNIALKNISLYINSILNQTISAGGTSYNAGFNLLNTADGSYSWYCQAYDTSNNPNISTARTFKVNRTATPSSSNFTGNTTDWNNVPDITNVSNAAVDNPSTGMIKWYNNINAEGANFDVNIILGNNYTEVITENLHPSFNSSAEITIRNLIWDAPPLVYVNGELCSETICSNVSYSSGTAVFNVTHFTNFTTTGNSQLEIWDETDPDKNNLTKYSYQQIIFFANYTKKANDQPILGATCTVDYTDSAGNAMTYNATSTLYEYNRSFAAPGIKPYNVTCSAAGFQTIILSDSANVSADNTPPNVTLNQPPQNYINDSSPSINITFNCSATDNAELSNISLYITNSSNQSFSLNQTASLSGISDSAQWNLVLGVGNYIWNCLAYDLSGNSDWDQNRTIKLNYTAVADNPPYWSNNQSNIVSTYSPAVLGYFNITWQDDNAVSTVWFESNYSGSLQNYSMNNIVGNVYNYSAILPAGTHYWKSYANDTINQWNQTDLWPFTIAKASTVLTLTILPSQTVINGTQTNVSCVANNAEVTINLYRNSTSVSNPDVQTLAAGDYNYTCNTTGSQNYTAASASNILTVTTKVISYCYLSITPPSPQTYPTAITASCSCTNPEASAKLYRNETDVTGENGTAVALAAGTYLYVCNVSETANYTSASNTSIYIIQAAPSAPPSGGRGAKVTIPKIICQQAWKCTEWGICTQNGTQSRACTDLNACEGKYAQREVDEIIRVEKPAEIRSCRYESCFDGIKNQNEEDVDCGGVCSSCPEEIARPIVTERTVAAPVISTEQIRQNAKSIIAVSITIILIIIIYINYEINLRETINILENIRGRLHEKMSAKEAVVKTLEKIKNRINEFLSDIKKYIKEGYKKIKRR